MNLKPSEEEERIAAAAREFLAKHITPSRVRELGADAAQPGLDDATWRRCAEQGWFAVSLDPAHGGLGLGLPAEVMLCRELGRRVTPGGFLPSMIGVRAAELAAAYDLVEGISSGERRVGLAVGDRGLDACPGGLLLRLDGAGAELTEIAAVEPLPSVDPGTRLSRVEPGRVVATTGDRLLLPRAHVLAAAELLGIIEAARDMSAEYARTREQFGRPIGAFQAVKHRCADMAIAAYAAVGQVHLAALYVESVHPDAAFQAASAYVLAAKGASRSTQDNIQNHGGIGFTWEHDAHFYLKRAIVLENLFGPLRTAYSTILAPARHEFR